MPVLLRTGMCVLSSSVILVNLSPLVTGLLGLPIADTRWQLVIADLWPALLCAACIALISAVRWSDILVFDLGLFAVVMTIVNAFVVRS